ncbi:MAG: NADH-quinone oxidoreductase subunit J [Planctomycetota bacterium]
MDLPYDRIAFFVFAIMAIATGIVVVVHRNPVTCAVSLVGTFLAVAGLYLTMGATFLTAVQILVYAGAIMVLFLFVIMLLNLEKDRFEVPGLSSLLGAAFALALMFAGVALVAGGSGAPATESLRPGTASEIGKVLFSDYLVPFEMASLLLLFAMIGAIVIARKRGIRSSGQGGAPERGGLEDQP